MLYYFWIRLATENVSQTIRDNDKLIYNNNMYDTYIDK